MYGKYPNKKCFAKSEVRLLALKPTRKSNSFMKVQATYKMFKGSSHSHMATRMFYYDTWKETYCIVFLI